MFRSKLGLAAGAAILVTMAGANATVRTYSVTLTFGDVSSDGGDVGTGPQIPVGTFITADGTWASGNIDSTGDKTWSASSPNTLSTITPPDNLFFGLPGNNGTSYFNPYDQILEGTEDYSADGESPNCITANPALVFPYACQKTEGKTSKVRPTPIKSVGPAPTASGIVTVDDVAGTLTGTLTLNDRGDGIDVGYAYRSADGSPFNASRNQFSTSTTIDLNLTGTFSDTSWAATGGTATFNDPAYECSPSDLSGTLCADSPVLGGHQADGSHASWINVPIYDKIQSDGTRVLLTTVPGVVITATLSGGAITAASGEYHRALGSASAGCEQDIVYSGGKMSCGNLVVGTLSMTGAEVVDETPVAVDDAVSTLPLTAVDIDVLDNDTDLNNPPLTVVASTPANGGTATVTGSPGNANAIEITYTPIAGITSDTFTYTITDDDGDADTATVTVTINDLPVTVDDTLEIAAGATANITVLANDTGLTDEPITLTIDTPPAEGTATVNGSTIDYTAGGNAGAFTIVYSATDDDGDTDQGTVNITVTDALPAAVADTATVAINQTVNVDVTANDTGLDNTPITVAIVTGPATGTAVVAGDAIAFTAGATGGTETIRYSVTDADGDTSEADITVTVTSVNTPDDFDLGDQFNVPVSTLVTSDTVTITGLSGPAPISVTGGAYSIGCTGTFVTTAGTIENDDTVCVQHTSASSRNSAVTTTLTIGSPAKSDAFTSSTQPITRSGSSSADAFLIGLLGWVAWARRRRFA